MASLPSKPGIVESWRLLALRGQGRNNWRPDSCEPKHGLTICQSLGVPQGTGESWRNGHRRRRARPAAIPRASNTDEQKGRLCRTKADERELPRAQPKKRASGTAAAAISESSAAPAGHRRRQEQRPSVSVSGRRRGRRTLSRRRPTGAVQGRGILYAHATTSSPQLCAGLSPPQLCAGWEAGPFAEAADAVPGLAGSFALWDTE